MHINAVKAAIVDLLSNMVLPQLSPLEQGIGLFVIPRLVNAKVASAQGMMAELGIMDGNGNIDSAQLRKELEENVFSKMTQFPQTIMGRQFVFTREHAMQIIDYAERATQQGGLNQ